MDRLDVIAWLLAARHDAEIQQMEEYVEARRRVEADPELAAAFEKEKAYYDQHGDYLDFIRLSDEARVRIKKTLREVSSPAAGTSITFPWRPLAIAASLVAVATMGMLALRDGGAPPIARGAPVTFDSFRQFAANRVDEGFTLDFPSADSDAVLSWLRRAGAPSEVALEDRFAEFPTMGCKVLNWEGHQVSLVCFEVADGVVHLFIAPASSLPSEELAVAAGTGVYTERETVSWADAEHAYVLVAHDPGQKLSEFPG